MKTCPTCDGFGRQLCPSCRRLYNPNPNCIHCHGRMLLPAICPSCNGNGKVPNYFLPSYDPYLEGEKQEKLNVLKSLLSHDATKRKECAEHLLDLHLSGIRECEAYYGETELISILQQALQNETDSKIRRTIVHGLGRFSHPDALEAMGIAIWDPNWEVRGAISIEVTNICSHCRIRYDEHPQREQILSSIYTQAKDLLTRLSADPHPEIRQFVASRLQQWPFR